MSLIKMNQETMVTYLELYQLYLENADTFVTDEDGSETNMPLHHYAEKVIGISEEIEVVKSIGLILQHGHKILEVENIRDVAGISSAFYVLRELLLDEEIIKKGEYQL